MIIKKFSDKEFQVRMSHGDENEGKNS